MKVRSRSVSRILVSFFGFGVFFCFGFGLVSVVVQCLFVWICFVNNLMAPVG